MEQDVRNLVQELEVRWKSLTIANDFVFGGSVNSLSHFRQPGSRPSSRSQLCLLSTSLSSHPSSSSVSR